MTFGAISGNDRTRFNRTTNSCKSRYFEYNLNDGNGWQLTRDDGDVAADGSTAYQMLVMDGPGMIKWVSRAAG